MHVIPDRELLTRQRLVVTLDDGRWETELEVLVEKGVKRTAGDGIVVVLEVLATQKEDIVLGPVGGVQLL